MVERSAEERSGPWKERVRFAPGGGFAYRPGELLLRDAQVGLASDRLRSTLRISEFETERHLPGGEVEFARMVDLPDPLEAMEVLRREEGIAAQVNHVLFATTCCPPHPSSAEAAGLYEEETDEGGMGAESLSANPFWARPFWARPFWARAGGGCGCCCGGGTDPFAANPFWARAQPSPFADPGSQATGRRRSTALPADPPKGGGGANASGRGVRVAVLDTGWAASYEPTGLPNARIDVRGGEHPDEANDKFLDPAAGHGTFIAGVIEQAAPGCEIEAIRVLSTFGDGDEVEVARTLSDLAVRPDDERPHLVNLSFGAYSPLGMAYLEAAIRLLHDAGVAIVASAGNDGTCVPMYPAWSPEVVGVAALDEFDRAAPFTNYGPWVTACAFGADVVSTFFEGFDGAEPPVNGVDPDHFEGWAVWSGTSFAAPLVVAALAQEVADGSTPHQAVEDLIDADGLERKPMLGTVVRPR